MKVEVGKKLLESDLYNNINQYFTIMIKKSIFKVFVFATAMTGAIVLSSCSHDDATYSPEEVQQAKHAQDVAKYEQAFVKMLGQPAANQCWDFTKGGTFTATRGANDNNSLNAWPSYSAYTYGFFDNYITGANDPLHECDINSIYKNDIDEIIDAIAEAEEKEEYKTWPPTGTYLFRTFATVKNSGTKKDKYYSIGANFNNTNNFIAQQGVGKNTKRGTTGSQHTCCIVFNKVPAGATWFAISTNKKNTSFKASEHELSDYIEVTVNGNTFWGFKCEEDGNYSDFILIVGKANVPVTLDIAKRYMVEDLGGSGESDIDFNDIVFDVLQYSDGSQKCVVRALGGTLPIKIKVGNSDWWSKPEPVSQMINTQGTIDYNKVIGEFTVTGWNEGDNNVQVMVEDINGGEFVTTFPKNGKIPAIIAFSAVKPWNNEKVPVTEEWFNTYPFDDGTEDVYEPEQ